MLEPSVITARVDRDRAAARRDVFSQLDEFIAELHSYDTHPQAKDALQMLVILTVHFRLGDFFERQHSLKEIDRTIHIADRQADRVNGFNERLLA